MAGLFGVRVTGPLQVHARGFSEQLTKLGDTRLPAAGQLRLMAYLSRWLAGRGLGAGQLTPQRAEQFLGARRRAGHASRRSQRGLAPLLGYLRGQGVTPQLIPPAACTPVQRMVDRPAPSAARSSACPTSGGRRSRAGGQHRQAAARLPGSAADAGNRHT